MRCESWAKAMQIKFGAGAMSATSAGLDWAGLVDSRNPACSTSMLVFDLKGVESSSKAKIGAGVSTQSRVSHEETK